MTRPTVRLAAFAVVAIGLGVSVARCDGSGRLDSVRFDGTGNDRAFLMCAEDGSGMVTLRAVADDESVAVNIHLDDGSSMSLSANAGGRGTASVVFHAEQWTGYKIVITSPSEGQLRFISGPLGCDLQRAS